MKKILLVDEAANKYLEELRISSASIDPRRDMDRRKGFVAGWNKSQEQISRLEADLKEKDERIEKLRNKIGLKTLGVWLNDDKRIAELEKELEYLKAAYYYELKEVESQSETITKLREVMLKAVRKYEAEMTNPFCMEWFKEAKRLLSEPTSHYLGEKTNTTELCQLIINSYIAGEKSWLAHGKEIYETAEKLNPKMRQP